MRTTLRFGAHHALRYGLEVVAQDSSTDEVTCVVCLFCRFFGREERVGKKRKTISTSKYFRAPFRTDLYIQHHKLQHPTKWEAYRNCSDDLKQSFFTTNALPQEEPEKEMIKHQKQEVAIVPPAPSRPPYRPTSLYPPALALVEKIPVENQCWFLIPKRIVDLILPLAASGEAQIWVPRNFRACQLVELSPSNNTKDLDTKSHPVKEKYYHVAIFNRMELELVVESLAAGLAPDHMALYWMAVNQQRNGREKGPPLPLLKEMDIRQLARLTLCSSMHLIGQLVARSWAIGLVLREVTAAPKVPQAGYLDVRIVGYAQGQLHDIHVLALPFFQYHTALALVQDIEKVLDLIFPLWRVKVLGITHDGRPTNTNPSNPASTASGVYRTAEVLAALETSIQRSVPVIPNRVLHKTWGACQQLSQTLDLFYDSLLEGQFLSTLRTLIACIQHNDVLLQEMGPPPSVFHAKRNNKGQEMSSSSLRGNVQLNVRTEWIAMGLDTKWITDKRVRLLKYLLNQQAVPSSSLSVGTITAVDDVWWVTFFVVHWIAARANEAFKQLQSPRLSRTRQGQILSDLFTELVSTFVIRREQQARTQEVPYYSQQKHFSILKRNVLEFLKDQGTFVSNVVAHVDPGALDDVLKNVAMSLVNLAEVLAELGTIPTEVETAKEFLTPLPPVVPYEFSQVSGREFTALLKRYEIQLSAYYPDEEVDAIEQEFQAFHRAAMHEPELKMALGKSQEFSFTKAWRVINGRFPLLEAFAGGLASAYAGRDSSSTQPGVKLPLGNSHEEGLRLAVADASLETTLHARQFDALCQLSQAAERTAIHS